MIPPVLRIGIIAVSILLEAPFTTGCRSVSDGSPSSRTGPRPYTFQPCPIDSATVEVIYRKERNLIIKRLFYSPDGRYLFSDHYKRIGIWETNNYSSGPKWIPTDKSHLSLAFSAATQEVSVITVAPCEMLTFHVPSGERGSSFSLELEPALVHAYSPDGRYLAVNLCCTDRSIPERSKLQPYLALYRYDRGLYKLEWQIPLRSGETSIVVPWFLRIDPKHRFVLVGSWWELDSYSIASGKRIAVLRQRIDKVSNDRYPDWFDISPDGSKIAISFGGKRPGVVILNAMTLKEECTLQVEGFTMGPVVFVSDNLICASEHSNGSIFMVNLNGGSFRRIAALEKPVMLMAYCPQQRHLAINYHLGAAERDEGLLVLRLTTP